MATDIVSVVSLSLSTTIGPDCWDRTRPQPIQLTLHLHLTPSFLDTAGETDNVTDSIHYGQLSKIVERRVGARHEGYEGIRALLEDVTNAAFAFAVENSGGESTSTGIGSEGTGHINAIHVLVSLPKQILLAGNIEVELTTPATVWLQQQQHQHAQMGSSSPSSSFTIPRPGAIVRVTDLVLPVLIGVNPPERLSKQRVITHLTFHEPAGSVAGVVDYPLIVKDISARIEKTEYLTLEKLVMEIVKMAFRASDVFETVTVCCQKPSALSFAQASAVQITRRREDMGKGLGDLST